MFSIPAGAGSTALPLLAASARDDPEAEFYMALAGQGAADGFAEANKRVRSAIRDRGWKFEVEPLPTPDLLGLYVLLPATNT